MNSSRTAGYARLLEKYRLELPEPHHRSRIRDDARPRRDRPDGSYGVEESFPRSYWPGDGDFEHLVFALKYDGVELLHLSRVFAVMDAQTLVAGIAAKPTSKYGRRLWFLYEWLTGARLPIPDLRKQTYVPALDPKRYYCAASTPSARHRVHNNLLGPPGFCPIVRRTATLERFTAGALSGRVEQIANSISPALLARAIWHLSGKETKSSFAIEREEPGDRMERFVAQLASISTLEIANEADLTALQNAIVDERYTDAGFRQPGSLEVYVGQTLLRGEQIHYIAPRSAITPSFMEAWFSTREVEGIGGAVIEAAYRSFAFVFIHPFSDGNGRIHRLLIHHILARRGFLPSGIIVPISSAMLSDRDRYDELLARVSRRVLPFVERRLNDENGVLTILNEPDDHYRYLDLTELCEATFDWLERAVERDLVEELAFLSRYDEIIERMRELVEMPDSKEQLFIKLCMRNHGRLARGKRRLFRELEDETITGLEAIIQDALSAGIDRQATIE